METIVLCIFTNIYNMEEEERFRFNFKQHIPKRFGRSYIFRMIVYILGFAVVLGLLVQKWNAADTNKNKIKVLRKTPNKEINVQVAPEKTNQ